MSLSLKIRTDQSNIQMETQNAQMDIQGQEATMTLDKTKGDFSINKKADTLEINSYPAMKQLNSYSPQDLMKNNFNEAKQKTSQAISQYVADGEAMMKIENKGKPLIEIGKRHGSAVGKTNLNVTHFPAEPIDIKVNEGYIDVQATPDEISPRVQKNLQINVQQGGVYTTVDGYPKVNIDVVGELIDSKA